MKRVLILTDEEIDRVLIWKAVADSEGFNDEDEDLNETVGSKFKAARLSP